MWRYTAKDRPMLGPFLWLGAIGVVALLLHSCGMEPTNDIQTAGKSFFPLAVGNKWIFQIEKTQQGATAVETVFVDTKSNFAGGEYYHLSASWPGFERGLWVRRDHAGNLTWTADGRSPEHQFLNFNVPVGNAWPTGLGDCVDSLSMFDDYAVVTTPYGRFDGVREIGDVGRCMDFGWGIKVARGVGPVAVSRITIAGPINGVLTGAIVHDDANPTD